MPCLHFCIFYLHAPKQKPKQTAVHELVHVKRALNTEASNNEPRFITQTNSKDSEKPAHPHSLARKYEPRHDKTNKATVCPAKTQITWASAQSDQSLHCPHEESLGL